MQAPDNGQFFAQTEQEFDLLLHLMKGSKSILEIGSRYGESLKRFALSMPVGSRVVSIDSKHDTAECPRAWRWWYSTCAELGETYDVHMIEGDSHDPVIVAKAQALAPYDFIFIDGDHSSEGVEQDWRDYGHLGKIVAFHDIHSIAGIGNFFDTLRHGKPSVQIRIGHGIGVIFQ